MVGPRASAGCSRIDSMVYCIGGAVYNQKSYLNAQYLNDHIALNLSQINSDFSTFNPSKLTWMTLSNINNKTGNPIQPIAFSAAASLSSDKSYIFYGGVQYTNNNYSIPDDIFMQYNPKENSWYPLPALPDDQLLSGAAIVNIGNDILMKNGGQSISEKLMNNTAALFYYKNLTWSDIIMEPATRLWTPPPELPRYTMGGHSMTLVGTNIYRIGSNSYIPITFIYLFSTIDMTWSDIKANGTRPSDRRYHTATYLPDKNIILLYGGYLALNYNDIAFLEDNYVIYNITSNAYIGIEDTTYYPFSKKRFGHYATLYNSNYLLLMFGYTENLQPSDTINVINITDPLKPIWITNTETTNDENNKNSKNNGLSRTTLIIIVVITIITVLSMIVGIIVYLKRKSQKEKKRLQLEKEDPRKSLYDIIKPYSNMDENDIIILSDNKHEKNVLKHYTNTNIESRLKPYDNQQKNHVKSNEGNICKPHESSFCEKTLLKENVEIKLSENKSDISSPTNTSTNSNTLSDTPIVEICKPSEDKNL